MCSLEEITLVDFGLTFWEQHNASGGSVKAASFTTPPISRSGGMVTYTLW